MKKYDDASCASCFLLLRVIASIWRSLICLMALWLCQGCSSLPAKTFPFADGGQAIYFSLDKSLEPASGVIQTYLFVVSGSDCTSMQYFLPDYFRGLEGESGSLRIFLLQKRFIQPRTWGRTVGCSDEFIREDHPRRWIADQIEFIQAQLALSVKNGHAPKRIVIVGISEGGDVVPQLAQRIAGVTHAVILANGGMDPIDAFRLQAKKHRLQGAGAVLDLLKHAPADLDAIDPALGERTWRYWTELHQLRHTDALLGLSIPLLAAMGEADQSVPIESLWYLRDRFAAAAKSNLTILSYPGADHALVNDAGSQLPQFWHAVDRWLNR